jgi:hypothetical protein
MRTPMLMVVLALAACDKAAPESDTKKDKEKEEASDDSVPVSKYCKKLLALSDKAAAANGKSGSEGGPTKDEQLTFCTMMFTNAKNKEPKAYACVADCMMGADTHEAEQTCVEEKKCLAKAKNKKLFSNRSD